MSVWEIILGVIMLILGLIIILTTLSQSPKEQDVSVALSSRSSTDSFYGKNGGKSKEDNIILVTKYAAIIFFIATLAANIVSMIIK